MRGNGVLSSAQTRMLSAHVSIKMADQKNLSLSDFQFDLLDYVTTESIIYCIILKIIT